jgi:hypothetical protein
MKFYCIIYYNINQHSIFAEIRNNFSSILDTQTNTLLITTLYIYIRQLANNIVIMPDKLTRDLNNPCSWPRKTFAIH